MRTFVIASLTAAVLVNGLVIASRAESAFVSYRDAVKACGVDWRASDERKNVAKGQGRTAWNAFRATCVTSKGYVKGRKAN